MIRDKIDNGVIVVDLTGPQGNAFYLLGLAKNLGKQMGMSPEEIKNITEEMERDDYEHLIHIFDSEFGDYVILER